MRCVTLRALLIIRAAVLGCYPQRVPPSPVAWASHKEGPVVLAAFGRRALLVAVLSLIPASVLAQGASTATIAGVVCDATGSVLPGATVEAASPALIEKVRSTTSD